jgi:hypothetical protein
VVSDGSFWDFELCFCVCRLVGVVFGRAPHRCGDRRAVASLHGIGAETARGCCWPQKLTLTGSDALETGPEWSRTGGDVKWWSGPVRHLLDKVAAEVDGVLALNDWGARLTAEIALTHDLPGAGETVATGLADKASVRSRLQDTDTNVRFVLTGDLGEAESLLESPSSGSAIAFRPAAGRAMRGGEQIWRKQWRCHHTSTTRPSR